MAYLTNEQLHALGLRSYGLHVLISDKVSLYGADNISIGDNVRIDDFCVISAVGGFITLHNHIHIAPFCSLFGSAGITMENFSGLSSYVSIYSASDDYSGDYLIGPVMDADCVNLIKKQVTIGQYATCGSHAVVLPGASMGEGSILGASSLATKPLNPWMTYSGVPAVQIKERKRGLLDKANLMLERRK